MITIPGKVLQNEIRLRINHKDIEKDNFLRPEQLDDYINRGLDVYVGNTLAKANTNPTTDNNLRFLERVEKLKVFTKDADKISYSYPKDHLKTMRFEVRASRECTPNQREDCKDCKNRLLIHRPFTQDNVNEGISSPYWRSSFEYEEIVYEKSDNLYHFYHHGEFDVDFIKCYYYRKPKYVRTPDLKRGMVYIDPTGKPVTTPVPLELGNAFQKVDIVDLAVLFIERDLRMVTDYQTQLQNILTRDKIFIN